MVDVRTCSVDGCLRPAKGRGWCNKHWKAWKRNGDPVASPPPRPRHTCSFEGCDEPHEARGWCSTHYQRWKRHRDPAMVANQRKATATYNAMHLRLPRDRGKASLYECVDCHRQADEWAYRHGCPDELVDERGRAYCLHPEHFDSRCSSCHAKFDGYQPTDEARRLSRKARASH